MCMKRIMYARDWQHRSWSAAVLQRLAPSNHDIFFLNKLTCL